MDGHRARESGLLGLHRAGRPALILSPLHCTPRRAHLYECPTIMSPRCSRSWPAPCTHLATVVHPRNSGAPFPLTPTLSLGETESIRPCLPVLSPSAFGRRSEPSVPAALRSPDALRSFKDGRGCSLSPRERVRVRGRGRPDLRSRASSRKCVENQQRSAEALLRSLGWRCSCGCSLHQPAKRRLTSTRRPSS